MQPQTTREASNYPYHFSITVDTSDKGKDVWIRKQNELMSEYEIYSKANTFKTKENKAKEMEIESLNDSIQKLMVKNYELEVAIQKEVKLRDKCENEQRRVAKYCNDIKLKFSTADKTISDYEATIAEMKKENERLSNEYDIKIEELERSNKTILRRIDDRIDVFNNNKAALVNGENRVNDIINEIEQQKNVFKERAMINKIKYDEWEKKYSNWQKKIYELQMNSDIKKAENAQTAKQVSLAQNEKEDLEKQILDIENNNKELMNQINEMTKNWQEISGNYSRINTNSVTLRKKNKCIGSERTSTTNFNSNRKI